MRQGLPYVNLQKYKESLDWAPCVYILFPIFRPNNIHCTINGNLHCFRYLQSILHIYTQDTLKFELAEKRFIALDEMVRYLDAVGTIFLVRLPTSEAMMNLENQAFPRFDLKDRTL